MWLLDSGAVATSLGYVSISCWLCAQLPQVIKNYQLSSCDGLSLPFLVTWLGGDLTNLIGCILTDQLPFQTYLATYFCFVDVALVAQYFYYTPRAGAVPGSKPGSPRTALVLPSPVHRRTTSYGGHSPHPAPLHLQRPSSSRGRKRTPVSQQPMTESPVFAPPSDSVEALYAAAMDVARAAERVSLRRSNSGRPRTRHATTLPSASHENMLGSFHSDMSLHSASEPDDDYGGLNRLTQSTGSLMPRGRSLTRLATRHTHSGTSTPGEEREDTLNDLPESGVLVMRRGKSRSKSRSMSAARARGQGRRAATVAFMSLGLLFWRGAAPGISPSHLAKHDGGHVVARQPEQATISIKSAAYPHYLHPVPLPFPSNHVFVEFTAGNHTDPGDEPRKPKPEPIDIQEVIGRISAWCCTTLYLSSRLPQIWKNFQRKSVEGLSILLFLFAFLGNVFYVASIMLLPVPADQYTHHLLRSLPYLLGSGGTLLFDLTIMLQALIYGSAPPAPPRPTVPRRAMSYGTIPRRRPTRHAEDGHGERRPLLHSPRRGATEPSPLRHGSVTTSPVSSAPPSRRPSALTRTASDGNPITITSSHPESGAGESALGVKLFGDGEGERDERNTS